jgi:hypothetical protein
VPYSAVKSLAGPTFSAGRDPLLGSAGLELQVEAGEAGGVCDWWG